MDTQENQDEPVEVESLRDTLEAAVIEVEASEPEATEPEVTTEPEPDSQDGPARGADGKYAKKEGEPDPAAQEATPEPDTAPATEGAEPPSSWKQEARDLFAKADPELRKYILQRESEQHEGVAKLKTEYEGKATFADDMWKEIAPYDHMIKSEGGTPVLAVRDLLGMAALMRTGTPEQKRGLLLDTARQFGVDLGIEQPDAEPANPAVDALQRELHGVKQTLTTWQQQSAQQQQQQLRSEIDTFKQDKPHFDAVAPTMGQLIQSGAASTLEDAYEKAVRLDDNLFAQSQADKAAADEAKRKADALAAAERAKAASVSVSGAPGLAGNGTTQAPATNLRAEIERNFAGRA